MEKYTLFSNPGESNVFKKQCRQFIDDFYSSTCKLVFDCLGITRCCGLQKGHLLRNSMFTFAHEDPPSIHSKSMNTPFCNRPSGIYILTGFFEKKTSLASQIFHQVASFCQDAVSSFWNDMRWECKSRIGEAANGPGKIKHFTSNRGGWIFFRWREKIQWVGFH